MSFHAMSWAVHQKLPCSQKIVLIMLAARHNKDSGQCNPSHDVLANDCGLSRRAVISQIAKLAEAGYLRIHRQHTNNAKRPNRYTLMFDFGVQEQAGEAEKDVNDVHMGDVNDVHMGDVNDVHMGSERGAHGSERGAHRTGKRTSKRTGKEEREREVAPVRASRLSLSDLPPEWSTWTNDTRPDLNPADIWDNFHDYWIAQPGQKGIKADWFATWRNWVRREDRANDTTGGKRNGRPHANQTAAQRHRAINSQLLADAREAKVDPENRTVI